jgi:uncharacterized protein
MKIYIPDIHDEGIELDLNETVSSDAIVSPVKGNLRVEKVGTEVIVRGNLEAHAQLQCSRCLKDFCIILSIPVDVVYHPVDELKGEDKHEVTSEELDMDFYVGEELDTERLINEQIVLNLPMKPLCNDLCRGICSRCGADLSAGACECEKENTDPRLGVLKKLLKE